MTDNTQSPEKFNSLELALAYVKRHPKRCLCPVKAGKKFPPLLKDNLDSNASNDPERIRAWSKQFPGCNWLLACKKSGLLVVDVDTNPAKNKKGQDTFDIHEMTYGWPDTETVTTPSGGHHHYYVGEHIMALGKNGLGMDIDVPNYVLIPGCTFDDGTSYVLANDLEAVACPDWIYDTIKSSKAKARITNAGEVVVDLDKPENLALAIAFLKEDAEPSIEGQLGDNNLFKTAAYLKDIGISQELGAQLLNEYFNPRCQPPWPFEMFVAKMASAYKSGNLSKVGGRTAEADFADDPIEPEPEPDAETTAKFAEQKSERKKNRESFGFDYVQGSSVTMQTIDWIWKDHLALGQHTCIAGVQGDGKSQLVYALAAAVTLGSAWPGTEEKAPIGNVILLNAEDTTADVMVPRLRAAGADMTKIFIVQAVTEKSGAKRKFNLQADLARLTKLAEKIGNVKLITFDPVSSYLGGNLDSHENTHLRDALDPITEMAERTGSAVISVTHFNKSSKGVSALNRVMGGAGFTAAPRAAFAVIRDAKNNLVRMMLSLKNNLAAEGGSYGMCFTLSTADVGKDERNGQRIIAPRVLWGEKTMMTADEALAANNEKLRAPTKRDVAINFIREMLANGPKLKREIDAAAAKRDIAPKTLRDAREELGVIAEKVSQRDGRGPWQWIMPDDDSEPDFDWSEVKAEFAEPVPLDPFAELM
jgi:hypothetical protein